MTELRSAAGTSLRRVVDSFGCVSAGTTLYLFGSVGRDAPSPRDIDVLLVYPDGCLADAHALAEAIRDTNGPRTVDVLAASFSEERELSLVATQQGDRIWPY